jgi:hypothetical protein
MFAAYPLAGRTAFRQGIEDRLERLKGIGACMADDGLVTLKSAHDVATTLARLTAALDAKGVRSLPASTMRQERRAPD